MADLISRVTRLEYGLVCAFLLLAGMIGGLYLYVGSHDNKLADRVTAVEATVGRLDERTVALQKQLDTTDGKIDNIDAKLDRLIAR